jgi:hypothetical protein
MRLASPPFCLFLEMREKFSDWSKLLWSIFRWLLGLLVWVFNDNHIPLFLSSHCKVCFAVGVEF